MYSMIDNFVFSCMHFGVKMVEISCIIDLNFNIGNRKMLQIASLLQMRGDVARKHRLEVVHTTAFTL